VALLTFPPTPYNGEIYPVSPPVGTNIYMWSSVDNTWRLLGPSTGVAAGTYGSATLIPQITVDATGRITNVVNVPIASRELVFLDDISSSFDGSESVFTLSIGGVPYTPTGGVLIFVAGSPQIPGSSYTTSGSLIVFSEAPPFGATFIGVTVN
jgi:hypothetical protein